MKIVDYKDEFGTYTLPEGFAETLRGLTVEEQMTHYRTDYSTRYTVTDWRDRTAWIGYGKLENCPDVKALIVHDGILVGVMMLNDCGCESPCFAEEGVCTYYADDNNGAGSKTRIDYTYLVCLPSASENA